MRRLVLSGTATAIAVLLACGDPAGTDSAPSIVVSSTSVTLQATTGGSNPATGAIAIGNGGGGTLSGLSASTAYTAGEPTGWLTATLSGTTAPSALTLAAATGALSAGTYTAMVTITAAGAANTSQAVTVTLVLGQAPAITIGPSDYVSFFATNGDPAPLALEITNAGGGTLDGLDAGVMYGASQPTGWLTATLSSTTTPSILTLSATTGAFGGGMYTATVVVTTSTAGVSPSTVTVVFTVLAAAIYVSESDPTAVDDATCGLGPTGTGPGHHPCSTIAQGLSRAVVTGRARVLVADGIYDVAVTLVNGKSLLGGYRPDTWERHLSTTNTIIQGVSSVGNHDRTVIASGITSSTVLEGFVVRGSLNAKPSGNSYALYVSNSNENLVIRNNVIHAGRGGPGAPGVTGANGMTGTSGSGRSSGPAAYDAKITTGASSCDALNNRQYTNGGASTVGGDDVSGGRGGGNACPVSANLLQLSAANGLTGQAGVGTGGSSGTGGAGGGDGRLETNGSLCLVPGAPLTMDGANGTNGLPGAHASAVAGGTSDTGAVVGVHWVGTSGAAGLNGSNGGGGGGGGAGGGAYCLSCPGSQDRLGGHGGGGGAGGAGGQGGGSGGAGGAAFGIFIIGGTAPVVTDNAIERGEGGTGGVGGNAGSPGWGGAGAAGGEASVFCTGAGGRGGDGGTGGYGSGGGGGSGGASFAIYTSGVGVPAYCGEGANNVIRGGAGGPGGAGGLSVISPGGAGVSGAVATCSFN